MTPPRMFHHTVHHPALDTGILPPLRALVRMSIQILIGSWLLGWAGLSVAAEPPYRQEIHGTTHDFSTLNGDPCLGCHMATNTPSGDELVASPLWGGGWASGVFGGPSFVAPGKVADPSSACLECHDGGLAVGVHQQKGELVTREHGGSKSPDHPVRLTYPRNIRGNWVMPTPLPQHRQYWAVPDLREGELVLPTGPTSRYYQVADTDAMRFGAVRTRSGKVECDSCHNPHSNRVAPYLRAMPPDLCLVCHDK
ncbi:MAG: cytochrome c3 family protein [Nitrospirota bacterium]|nr:cytochrome c3 family protein [Nitrospirota bacterium]